MNGTKKMMSEAATLYYKKKLTQQEIADILNISRQTVSKLISDAVENKIVEIKIHDPDDDCREIEKKLCEKFNLNNAVVCSTSGENEVLRQMQAVKSAIEYLTPLLKSGNKKIAISWGRTIEALISDLEPFETENNIVYPLFGATDTDKPFFLPNELARNLADKLCCKVKSAWFPYLPDSKTDCELFKNTSYYRSVKGLWGKADISIVGIGDTTVLKLFEKTFGSKKSTQVVGDIATHFFTKDGQFVPMYENRLCASLDDLKSAQTTVAVACGDKKVTAIKGALKTGVIDVLITDEYTAKLII